MMYRNIILILSFVMSLGWGCSDKMNSFAGGSKKNNPSPSGAGDEDGIGKEKEIQKIGEVDPWDDLSDHQFNEDATPNTGGDTGGLQPVAPGRGIKDLSPVGDSSLQKESSCRYLDPAQRASLPPEEVAGGPPIAVPLAKYIQSNDKVKDDKVLFRFTAFKHHSDDTWITEETWAASVESGGKGGSAGWVPYNYDAVLNLAGSQQCSVEAKFANTDVRTLSGCFDIETEIMTREGYRKAYSLAVGDELFNPMVRQYQKIEEVRLGPENKVMFHVAISSGSLKVTGTHPFQTSQGIKQAKELKLSDSLMMENGRWSKINAIQALPLIEGTMVVNFVLSSNGRNFKQHHVLANGIVAGDLFMQREVEAARAREKTLTDTFLSLNLGVAFK